MGVVWLAPVMARIPPEMSCPLPPVNWKTYEEGSADPASLYQAWILALLPSNQSVLGTRDQPAGADMLRS